MPAEHLPLSELGHEVVRAYANTFIPRADLYSLQLESGRYVCVRKQLGLEMVASHFQGIYTLGTYALDQQSRANWLCFDADAEGSWLDLVTASVDLSQRSVPSYLEQSRRGGHLWVFLPLSPRLSGSQARELGHYLMNTYDIRGTELFPKQGELKTGPGSLMRLPLGIHRKTGRRYHFIHPDGSPLAPTIHEQIEMLAFPQRVSWEVIKRFLEDAPSPSLPPSYSRLEPSGRGMGETLSERLKDRISVYSFVGQSVPLDERGMGHCPFHEDAHKSFGVDREHDYWHCFAGCGGGSIIDFWMRWRRKQGQDPSFVATITDLSKMLF